MRDKRIIITYLLLIMLFVTCGRDEGVKRSLVELGTYEIDELKSYKGSYFDIGEIKQEADMNTVVELELKGDLYDKNISINSFEDKLGPYEGLESEYGRRDILTYKIVKISHESIEYTGVLYRGDKEMFRMVGGNLLKVLEGLNSYFLNYKLDVTNKLGIEEYRSRSKDIMGNDESMDSNGILYDISQRGFFMNNILSVRLVEQEGRRYIKLYNPLPYNFEDMKVILYTDIFNLPISLMELEEVAAFSELIYPFDRLFEEGLVTLVNGETHEISEASIVNLNISLLSKDRLFEKLEKIKATNFVSFDYEVRDKWIHLLGEDAKRYMALLVNMYYMISTEEFEKEFVNTNNYLYDDNGIELTLEKKREIYNEYISRRINIRLVKDAQGRATLSGYNIGLARGKFAEFYKDPNKVDGGYYTSGVRTWSHEIGHNLGYNHSSNMTYAKEIAGNYQGATEVWERVYKLLEAKGDLPFMQQPY